ncbi:FAD-dependent oxidoreductase [Nocardia implantans]|uniref:FAD-dependent oxidoreductase n=1 Tax=Nocardia implantans TaxID=3108168 RepID=A0ABU6ALP1_9NOCA|nr:MULTISPECIES: FAD-dependent oxidoreductase [unclassified Nocardia]MBF6193296.1 FAD-dependent oxidoreductase [Nocardia beijingensis]MEA3531566.1 FAD-dependent oxidoreductase [Nocardia sp. CDC192]MEB3508396.1 FAD-dependent oxidoreductase [Nocardia sp. CDC186]
MTGQHRIVVLGAGYAGLAAARRLARTARDARITVVDAHASFVERVRLHQQAAGQRIAAWDLRETLENKGIGFVRAMATEIDTGARRVVLDAAPALEYDTLIYALGSVADRESVPGVAEHAYSVATREDVRGLAFAGGPVAIVGAGATGIELAAELAESHPDSGVLLLGSEEPGAWLSARAQAHIRRTLQRLGVEIRSGAKVIEVTPEGPRSADGTLVEAAATVWTTGFRVPHLAARSGLAVDPDGRVLTDATLRSVSHPEIFAAGDAAVVAGPGGRELRMACATALPTGKHAADAAVARMRGREPGELRFRYVLQCISLGRNDGVVQAVHADDAPARTVLTGRTAAWVKERIVRGAAWAARP